MLRADSVDFKELKDQLITTGKTFTDSASRQFIPDSTWATSAKYKWNSDSSVIWISAAKNISKEHKREIILAFGDTAIVKIAREQFFDQFRRNSNGMDNPGYIFMEEVIYLTQKRRVLILRRIDFDNTGLQDSALIEKREFINHTATDGAADFSREMEYATRILNRN
jgi:hypothetical protein